MCIIIQYASHSETDKTYNPYCKGSMIDLNIWRSMDLYCFGVFFFLTDSYSQGHTTSLHLFSLLSWMDIEETATI